MDVCMYVEKYLYSMFIVHVSCIYYIHYVIYTCHLDHVMSFINRVCSIKPGWFQILPFGVFFCFIKLHTDKDLSTHDTKGHEFRGSETASIFVRVTLDSSVVKSLSSVV